MRVETGKIKCHVCEGVHDFIHREDTRQLICPQCGATASERVFELSCRDVVVEIGPEFDVGTFGAVSSRTGRFEYCRMTDRKEYTARTLGTL